MAEAPQDSNPIPEWRITGDWFDLCNCAVGCPCLFGSDPTLGYCEALLAWIIRDGHFGKVRLGGDLGVVFVDHFKGSVLEKNREFGFLFDERADPAQREALKTIFSGAAGGCFAAWRDLTLTVTGIAFVPMTISVDKDTWKIEVPGIAAGEGGPFRKYMVPEGETCRIYNAPRPEVTPGFATVGQSRFFEADAFGRRFQWRERSAKHIAFDLRGPGAFSWRQPVAERE